MPRGDHWWDRAELYERAPLDPLPGRARDSASPVDGGQVAQLRRFILWLLAVIVPIAAFQGVVAVLAGDPRTLITTVTLAGYGAWLAWAQGRLEHAPHGPIVHRLTAWMFAIIGSTAVLRPGGGEVIAVATLLPVAIALPFLAARILRRLMVLAWIVAVLAIAVAVLLPGTSSLPTELSAATRVVGLAVVIALVLLLLGQFGVRLKETARQLSSMVAMSRDLGQTLEPLQVGDLMARHLALAVEADECGICFWDRSNARVLTYGYYPLERRDAVDESYALDDYPLTRDLLERPRAVVIDEGDTDADPHEVAYVRSLGRASMAMIPLVAKGRAVGLVELMSRRAGHFDRRRLELASTMATEAAMALENARLHDELRRLAYHDPVTGLANRTLFLERLEEALARSAGPTAVLFIDVDDFKRVNDLLGHESGDRLLEAIADRLEAALRPDDTAARIGGDEFGVLLPGLDQAGAAAVAGRLIIAAAEPVTIAGATLVPSFSIGVTSSASGETSAQDLLRESDLAMYRAKLRGKGRFEVFDGAAGAAAELGTRGAA